MVDEAVKNPRYPSTLRLVIPPTRFLVLVCALALTGSANAQGVRSFPGPDVTRSENGSENPNANRPPVDVDVVLERLDLAGKSEDMVGESVVNDDARQTLKLAMYVSQTHNFLAHIKNTGRNATTFQVHLNGPRSAQGTSTAWQPKGWSCHATLDGDTNNILQELQSKAGWTTPRLKPGAETIVRLAFTTPAASPQLAFEGSFRLVADKDEASDTVVGELGVQYIRGIEWSVDGFNWVPVNGTVRVPELQNVLLRVVAANPKIGWEDFLEFAPTWDLQESWAKKPTHHLGEMISLDTERDGIINFTATGGNKIDGRVELTAAEEDEDDE